MQLPLRAVWVVQEGREHGRHALRGLRHGLHVSPAVHVDEPVQLVEAQQVPAGRGELRARGRGTSAVHVTRHVCPE